MVWLLTLDVATEQLRRQGVNSVVPHATPVCQPLEADLNEAGDAS
jgi:hypothetical protein